MVIIYMLVFYFSSQVSIKFIDVKEEINKISEGRKEIDDLAFDYELITFLDTSFYNTISSFEGFNSDISPQVALNTLEGVYTDIRLIQKYTSIKEVIMNQDVLDGIIDSDQFELLIPVSIHNNRAIISTYSASWDIDYMLELVEPLELKVFVLRSTHHEAIPQSLLDLIEAPEKKKKN